METKTRVATNNKNWYSYRGYIHPDKDDPMRLPPITDKMVGFLCIHENGEYVPIGTGFILSIEEPAFAFHYLITCKHVVKAHIEVPEPIYLRVNRTDIEDIYHLELPAGWIYHPDKSVDLAVLPIPHSTPILLPPLATTGMGVEQGLLSSIKQLEDNSELVARGDDVIFIGLFQQYMGNKRIFPVARFGKVALVPTEPVYAKPYKFSEYILVECLAFEGFSGSPVFILHLVKDKDEYKPILLIMGVIQGYYEQANLAVESGGRHRDIYTHLGITLVTPDTKIREILYGEKLMKARQDRLDAGASRYSATPASVKTRTRRKEVPDEEGEIFTREDFFKTLGKASRPIPPPPDEGTSET